MITCCDEVAAGRVRAVFGGGGGKVVVSKETAKFRVG
jgi:hypothetical protein